MSDSESKTGRSASGRSSRNASSSPPPRTAGSQGSSRSAVGSAAPKAKSSPMSAGSSSSAKGKKGSKGSSKKKKKKKKPIVEEPKFVRDLVAKSASGDRDWVAHFLASAEYVGKFDFNQTAGEALVAASEKNNAEIVGMILTHGAPPNLLNGKPLQRAAFAGSLSSCAVLLAHGAEPDTRSTFAEYTALMYAAQSGHLAVLQLLLEKGAVADTVSSPDQAGLTSGWTALHFASDGGHEPCVVALLDSGASTDALNSNGDTPCAVAAERGQWDVVRTLVRAGANIAATRRGLSVVQWAVYRGDHDAVQFLVTWGAVPILTVRVLWFPPNQTLKEVIYSQFSEDVYDQIDLAIYRGGKLAMEREAKKKLMAALVWETAPGADPYSFDPNPTMLRMSFPTSIINLISGYDA